MRRPSRAAVLAVLIDSNGFVGTREIADALTGEVGAAVVRQTLDALTNDGILERRSSGRRRPFVYRVVNTARARSLANERSVPKAKSRKRTVLSNALKNDRAAVERWLSEIPWDSPVRESLTAYARGDISFADLARVLERERYPAPPRSKAAR